jgi:precorrin-2 dehydrogenase/sirohydrochlorin ferrochelatase
VVRRGRLTIAVSTGGASPAWARHIKERIGSEFGEEYTRLFDALAAARRHCLREIPDPARRRAVLEGFADESLIEAARAMSVSELESHLIDHVCEPGRHEPLSRDPHLRESHPAKPQEDNDPSEEEETT